MTFAWPHVSSVSNAYCNYRGKRRDSLVGTLSAGPLADSIDTPEYKAFVASYKKNCLC